MSRFVFGLGEVVTWKTTQGRTATGTVVRVLPPYKLPTKEFPRLGVRKTTGRDHETYVVETVVNGKKQYFWPLVQTLRAAV